MSDIEQEKAYQLLLSRFRNLLESETIRKFDQVDIVTGKYTKDIKSFDGYMDGLKAAISELIKENARTEQELEKLNGGWVKCEDGLPKKPSQRVNATLKNGMVLEVWYISNKFKIQTSSDPGGLLEIGGFNPVIAWQPLPPPYQPTDTVNHIQV